MRVVKDLALTAVARRKRAGHDAPAGKCRACCAQRSTEIHRSACRDPGRACSSCWAFRLQPAAARKQPAAPPSRRRPAPHGFSHGRNQPGFFRQHRSTALSALRWHRYAPVESAACVSGLAEFSLSRVHSVLYPRNTHAHGEYVAKGHAVCVSALALTTPTAHARGGRVWHVARSYKGLGWTISRLAARARPIGAVRTARQARFEGAVASTSMSALPDGSAGQTTRVQTNAHAIRTDARATPVPLHGLQPLFRHADRAAAKNLRDEFGRRCCPRILRPSE